MASELTYYNAKTTDSDATLQITKFNSDFGVINSYHTSKSECTCPAGHRPSCRHRDMFRALRSIADKPDFLCFETLEVVHPRMEDQGEI